MIRAARPLLIVVCYSQMVKATPPPHEGIRSFTPQRTAWQAYEGTEPPEIMGDLPVNSSHKNLNLSKLR